MPKPFKMLPDENFRLSRSSPSQVPAVYSVILNSLERSNKKAGCFCLVLFCFFKILRKSFIAEKSHQGLILQSDS